MPAPRRILFATHGSLGDLHPFLAVGQGLKRRGHLVTIATHAGFRGAVEGAGLRHHTMRPHRPADAAFLARIMDRRTGARFVFRDYLDPAIRESFEDLAAALPADVLVSQTLALAAPLLAEARRIPWISTALQPSMMYSAYDPPKMAPLPLLAGPKPFSVRFNRKLYAVAAQGTEGWVRSTVALRRELGLGPAENPILMGQHSPDRILAMFSPLLGAPQPDWPAQTRQTGAVFFSGAAGPGLPEFQDAPVLFTLGSAATYAGREFFRVSVEVAERLGRPALLVLGGRQDRAHLPRDLPAEVRVLDYAAYEHVFPRSALIVHQGGIGTTHWALWSGRPMLVVPFAQDQLDNAVRIVRLGAGRAMRRERYGARRVASLLRSILDDDALHERARRSAALLREENGIETACNEIERFTG